MAMGAGGATLVPMLGWLIAHYGWRLALVVVGGSVLGIGLPLSLVIRNVPEDKGLLPDGKEAKAEVVDSNSGSNGVREIDFSVKEAMKTLAFWMVTLGLMFRVFVLGATWVHMVPLFVSKGLEQQAATNAVGLLLIIAIPSHFMMGWLGDIYPKRYLLMFGCFVETFALAILLTAQSVGQVYLFVLIYGAGYGVAPLNISIVGEYFGRKNFATIRGIMALLTAVGGVAGPIYAGYIYDTTQSYDLAFIGFAVFYFLAAIIFFFARRPKPPATVAAQITS